MKVDRPSEVVSVIMSDGISNCGDCADRTPTNAKCQSHPVRITHLNDALLAQLDLPKMESFWFTAAGRRQSSKASSFGRRVSTRRKSTR